MAGRAAVVENEAVAAARIGDCENDGRREAEDDVKMLGRMVAVAAERRGRRAAGEKRVRTMEPTILTAVTGVNWAMIGGLMDIARP